MNLFQIPFYGILLLNILSLISLCVLCNTPLVQINVQVNDIYFKLDIPVDVGLFKCFSKVCSDYNNIKHTIDNDKISSSSSSSTGGSIPSIINPKISGGSTTKIVDKFIRQEEKYYKFASTITIPQLLLATILSITSILTAIHCCIYNRVHLKVNLQNNLTIVSSILLITGTITYMASTYRHIHGGYYLPSVYSIISLGITSLVACFLFHQILDSRDVYHPISPASEVLV